MIAYCGLDCSKCDGYIAAQSGDDGQVAAVAKKWSAQYHAGLKPEHVACDGCKGNGRKSLHCASMCKIRVCCVNKQYDSCAVCADFPCGDLKFVLDSSPEARENMNRLMKK
jgi:hypothetical protein